ncbi:MAG: hypothetical protein WBM99_02670 [Psychromonas sp.]
MKTTELLKLSDADMASSIMKMKLKECDKHTKNYAKRLNLDFDKLIIIGTNAVFFSSAQEHVSLRVQADITEYSESIEDHSEDQIGIMSALILMLIYKKTNGFDMAATLANLSKA